MADARVARRKKFGRKENVKNGERWSSKFNGSSLGIREGINKFNSL